jgi:hypothetical protein
VPGSDARFVAVIAIPAHRRLHRGALVVIVALLATTAPATSAGATSPGATAPAEWDPRIESIAEQVEELRDLEFEHPVRVRFLADEAFERRQRSDRSKLSEDEDEEVRRTQAQLRALGLIGAEVDLFEASNDIRSSGVLAYYDPTREEIVVKGKGALDVATRVVVAHELTHALQDQEFDLARIDRVGERNDASLATRALIEGDASRVEDLYRAQLSSDEQESARDQTRDQIDDIQAEADEQQIPEMLSAIFQAPYAFGPSMVEVGASLDGGVDELFRKPPTNESAFLTPSTLASEAEFEHVLRPKLRDGEQRIGEVDVFGAFGLYLVLASRLGPEEALRVADGWGGDSMISFERDGQTCLRVTVVGRGVARTAAIGGALDQWAAPLPPGTATVDRGKQGTTLTVCDTGVAGPAIAHDGEEVLAFAAVRDTFYASLLRSGAPSAAALCAADGLVRDPVIAPLLAAPDEEPDAATLDAIRTQAVNIAAECARSQSS